MRLTLLTEIPAPYRIPLFNALAERVELAVVFLADRHPQRPYRLHESEMAFQCMVLPHREVTLRGRWVVLNGGVGRALRGSDVVLVGGWNQPAFWQALAWTKVRRLPLVGWVESTGRDHRSARFDPARRAVVRAIDAFVVPGRESHAYLGSLGIEGERITTAPNAVDRAIFEKPQADNSSERERPVVLAVGRLAPEKGLDILLEATRDLPVEVVLAGSGPEDDRLRALAGSNVRFLGQVDRDDLPGLYATADVLALPSRSEAWGMVLNEAGLAGLPLVASDAAGGAHELVIDGENGFRVPAGDVGALRAALRRLVEDPDLCTRFGARSREIASAYSAEAWADAVAALCTSFAPLDVVSERRG